MSLPRLLISAALVFIASVTSAQKNARVPGDFAVANIFATPDNLLRVHSFGPGILSPGKAILATPVDYLRGLVFDDDDSGWYVSGYSEVGGPTGFYRFAHGQSTLVAPFPLGHWGSLADMSWSKQHDFIWYVWDPLGAQKETLYQISLDGQFTMVGEIHYATGVALDMAGGIALDPHTGVLYSYDQRTAALITVDPATAEATRIGPSGLAPYSSTVIMSMDFSNDGRLFMIRNFGTLYEADLATGHATVGGQVNTACSSLAFIPPPRVER